MPLTTDKSKKPRKKRAALSSGVHAVHKARIHPVPGTTPQERIFGREGVLTLDANSATFTSDLTLMFEKNVARARREHKRKAVSAGRAR